MKSKIPDKEFTFSFKVTGRAYNPYTCEQDYGSKESYNSDFPEHTYASETAHEIFKDAINYCLFMMKEMQTERRTEIENWDIEDKELYKSYKDRIDLYKEIRKNLRYNDKLTKLARRTVELKEEYKGAIDSTIEVMKTKTNS